jgi:riboflavin kinase / FMN adenylyltransferase
MERIFGLKKFVKFPRPVATLGVFDGVHRGHLLILQETTNWARSISGTSMVITFDRHPDAVVRALPEENITSLEHRLDLIEKAGVDAALVLHFGEALAAMEAEDFVKSVLVEAAGVAGIVLGFNARFGRHARGDVKLLERMGAECGFQVKTAGPLIVDGSPVSSTRIRTLIRSGRLDDATRLLGRGVSLRGTVVHGAHRGRALGFPTANLNLHHEVTPPSGVYIGKVRVDDDELWGLVNIGTRPTFCEEEHKKTVEVYIDRFEGSLYGKTVEVELMRYLRAETRFVSADALTIQMEKDKRILEAFRRESDGEAR